jgi:hypothetical protein
VIWFDVPIKFNIRWNIGKIKDALKIGTGVAKCIYMIKSLTILLAILLVATPSSAEFYKWTDEKGVVHFTDDSALVPEKYRLKIKRMGLSEDEKREENDSLSGKKETTYLDRLGRGEEYWKGRVDEQQKRIKGAQEKMIELRAKYNDLTEKFNDSRSSLERSNFRKEREQIKEELDRFKAQVEEAKAVLEKKIPEEIELYKAKPDWIKQ